MYIDLLLFKTLFDYFDLNPIMSGIAFNLNVVTKFSVTIYYVLKCNLHRCTGSILGRAMSYFKKWVSRHAIPTL